jgi:hypothetical protein
MFASRESDERLLKAIRLKCRGWTWKQIATRLEYPDPEAMRIACTMIRRDDVNESAKGGAETPLAVRSAYW